MGTDNSCFFLHADLAALCQVRGIPCGIVLNTQGLFITNKGREDIQQKRSGCLNEWRQCQPLPIAEGIAQANETGPGGMVWKMVMGLFKNPIYIFGMLYLLKWFARKFAGDTPAVEGTEGEPLSPGDMPISDDEF